MTLMRREEGYSSYKQLECLYNMHREYKFYIRIHEIIDIAELQARAREQGVGEGTPEGLTERKGYHKTRYIQQGRMLLATQVVGSHPPVLQTPREEVLLAMRAGRSAHLAVLSVGGKSRRDRRDRSRVRIKSESHIKSTPRPHTTIRIGGAPVPCSDTGFETSLINDKVAETLCQEGFPLTT